MTFQVRDVTQSIRTVHRVVVYGSDVRSGDVVAIVWRLCDRASLLLKGPIWFFCRRVNMTLVECNKFKDVVHNDGRRTMLMGSHKEPTRTTSESTTRTTS